ncbi:hypothetical protein D9M68_917110 [compost metagenome]
MLSSITKAAAVSSVNWALNVKPRLLKNALDAGRSATGILTKMDVDMFCLHLLNLSLNNKSRRDCGQVSHGSALARAGGASQD